MQKNTNDRNAEESRANTYGRNGMIAAHCLPESHFAVCVAAREKGAKYLSAYSIREKRRAAAPTRKDSSDDTWTAAERQTAEQAPDNTAPHTSPDYSTILLLIRQSAVPPLASPFPSMDSIEDSATTTIILLISGADPPPESHNFDHF